MTYFILSTLYPDLRDRDEKKTTKNDIFQQLRAQSESNTKSAICICQRKIMQAVWDNIKRYLLIGYIVSHNYHIIQ